MPFPKETVKVLIGDNAIATSRFGKYTVLELGSCEAISINYTSDGVFFSARLQDGDGNRVIDVVDNKITALNGEQYVTRQSRDRSTITVTNKRGTTLFYARFLNSTTVRVSGFFGRSNNRAVLIRDNQPVPGMFMSGLCVIDGGGGIKISD